MTAARRGPQEPPEEGRWGFYRFVVNRPVAVTMLVLAVLVFGLISFNRLPLTLMPDISYPSITLRSEFEGAAPEEVEQYVTRPLEQALAVIGNMVSMSSASRAGQSELMIEFAWDTDMDQAIQEVREKLDNVWLPVEVERPLILRYDPSLDPVMRIGVTSESMDLEELRILCEDVVKRELEKTGGVAAVKVQGGLEEEIRVELVEKEISLRGLDLQNISRQLSAENVNLAGGNLKEGRTEYVVRVLSEYKSVEEIADTRIRTGSDSWVRLGDIGRVYRGARDPDVITRVDGVPSVEIEVHKEADANVVRVAESVRQRLFGPSGQPPQPPQPGPAVAEADSSAAADSSGAAVAQAGGGGHGNWKPWWLSAVLAERGIQTHLLADQSTFIQGAIDELKGTALFGGLFAVLVLFLFLRSAYTTLIVALAIPLSVVAAFGPMQLSALSLNIMSLGGLALGIGMLVDNAIVVLESIFRCREEGDDVVQAAIRGTGEVGGAVFASTLTTIAVFFPMVFVEGIAGQIFGDLSRVVVYSLTASLILALSFIPMLAALHMKTGRASSVEKPAPFHRAFLLQPLKAMRVFRALFRGPVGWCAAGSGVTGLLRWPLLPLLLVIQLLRALLLLVVELVLRLAGALAYLVMGLFGLLAFLLVRATNGLGALLGRSGRSLGGLGTVYPRLLGRCLRHRTEVMAFVVLAFAVCVWQVLPRLGQELMPVVHQGEFHLDMVYPVGTPIERTAESLRPIEDFLEQQPQVASLATVVGGDDRAAMDREIGEHIARITVRLHESDDPEQSEQTVLARLRPFLDRLPELESRVSYPVLFSFRTPIEIQLRGYELHDLAQANEQTLAALRSVPGLADLNSSLRPGNPELKISYRREALNRLQLDLQQVAELVRAKILGNVDTEFRDEDRRVDVRVKLRDPDLLGVDAIRGLVINPGQPVPVPLSAVADVSLAEGPSEVRREDQERSAVIRANLADRDLGSAIIDIRRTLDGLVLPEGIRTQVVGQSQEMARSMNSLYMALMLAIFLVYVVMASQFESLLHPLVILFSVPLAFVGVMLALWAFNMPLSVVVFLGAILLVGIVVNNAIILVDTINLKRSQGEPTVQAIIHAGSLRLRPILMTTGTTVLGLLPMALGAGEASEMRAPMAITVIVGLLSSTLLTLLVVPTLYSLLEVRQEELEALDEAAAEVEGTLREA